MRILALVLLICTGQLFAQNAPGALTVEKIMRDPKWIGHSPSGLQWSVDGSRLAFNWNPGDAESDSLYYITARQLQPQKMTAQEREDWLSDQSVEYNSDRTAYTYSRQGDIYYHHIRSKTTRRVTNSTDNENNPGF